MAVSAEHKLVVRDGERVREVLLVGTVTVGRSPTCEISSADPRLSRTHAAFDIVGGDVVVRDLGSSNGTTVNGQRITEHRVTAGDRVEVGPFVMQLVEPAGGSVDRRPPPVNSDDDATIMRSPRARGGVAAEPPAGAQPVAPPPSKAPHESDVATRMVRRSPAPSAAPSGPVPQVPVAPDTPPRPERPAPAAVTPPAGVTPAQPIAETPAPVAPPKARRTAAELTFANVVLLWIAPLVLLSFVGGLVPGFTEPDERTPLLRAHYVALATAAVDLVKASSEPAMPIDNVTNALRRQAGVTGARIVAADGRVLAPLDQAGTTVPAPVLAPDTAPRVVEAADGSVEIQASAQTADGRPVMIALTVDPERIHPAPPRSAIGTLLLIISLGAAWAVARHLTKITDARLSSLGEEVELMMTGQVRAGRDPFNLGGGQRVVDAVTFALSAAGRIASDAPRAARPAGGAEFDTPSSAAIDADAGFRIVNVDRGCEGLLGMNVITAPGQHLIEALPDQAVSDEVMRLLTMATPNRAVGGEVVSADRGIRLGIEVSGGAGDALLSIRFKRL